MTTAASLRVRLVRSTRVSLPRYIIIVHSNFKLFTSRADRFRLQRDSQLHKSRHHPEIIHLAESTSSHVAVHFALRISRADSGKP